MIIMGKKPGEVTEKELGRAARLDRGPPAGLSLRAGGRSAASAG